MVDFERIRLENGVVGLIHTDQSTPLVALNVLVDAGSKYDPEGRSGLAHLFEHLMFKGTADVPDFDRPMQRAAAENNAYTNADYATYYCFGPAQNVETYLYLERDRLRHLILDQERLELERRVVIEEYLETCVNTPFGDLWHHLLPMMYDDHPYRWPTIGESTVHLQDIQLSDLQAFYAEYYHPSRITVALSGNIELEQGKDLVHRWFRDLPDKSSFSRKEVLPPKPRREGCVQLLQSNVPVATFYLAWSVPDRLHPDYPALDVVSELLAGGRSAILYQHLVKSLALLSEVDCYLSGTIQGGLVIIEGRLQEGVDFEAVYDELHQILEKLAREEISEEVLSRLKNGMETSMNLSEMNVLSKAINLAYFELLDHAELINQEPELYRSISSADIRRCIQTYLNPAHVSRVEYHPVQG